MSDDVKYHLGAAAISGSNNFVLSFNDRAKHRLHVLSCEKGVTEDVFIGVSVLDGLKAPQEGNYGVRAIKVGGNAYVLSLSDHLLMLLFKESGKIGVKDSAIICNCVADALRLFCYTQEVVRV